MNGLFGEVGAFGLSGELDRYSEGWGEGEGGETVAIEGYLFGKQLLG